MCLIIYLGVNYYLHVKVGNNQRAIFDWQRHQVIHISKQLKKNNLVTPGDLNT